MNAVQEHHGAYQSWEEIRRAYPDEWVIVFEVQDNEEDADILGGVVMAHSAIRKEALDAIPRDRPTSCAILYTGAIRRRSGW